MLFQHCVVVDYGVQKRLTPAAEERASPGFANANSIHAATLQTGPLPRIRYEHFIANYFSNSPVDSRDVLKSSLTHDPPA
jgi:hypothetical protein